MISYREVAHQSGAWRWAFDLAACDHATAQRMVEVFPHISYIGKRGSFIQFRRFCRLAVLGVEFTQPIAQGGPFPPRAHIVPLDDLGPEADLETLSSFTTKRPRRDVHRRFVDTIVPLGIVNSGPGFTEYARE
jgi:hypothetical protein